MQEVGEYVACFAQARVVDVAWLLRGEIGREDVLIYDSPEFRWEECEGAGFGGVEGENGVEVGFVGYAEAVGGG